MTHHTVQLLLVSVSRNYVYESPGMCADPVYQLIRDTVGRMNNVARMRLVDAVNDSHDVVEWQPKISCLRGWITNPC